MAASSFFSNLGDTLSKTVKEVSGRAGNAYETQKIKNKISGEEKQIQKIMADIGKIVYERYTEGVPVEEAQKTLKKCGMSEIYIVNPYECFLLMCLLTDCPLAVFSEIWEKSYEETEEEN